MARSEELQPCGVIAPDELCLLLFLVPADYDLARALGRDRSVIVDRELPSRLVLVGIKLQPCTDCRFGPWNMQAEGAVDRVLQLVVATDEGDVPYGIGFDLNCIGGRAQLDVVAALKKQGVVVTIHKCEAHAVIRLQFEAHRPLQVFCRLVHGLS